MLGKKCLGFAHHIGIFKSHPKEQAKVKTFLRLVRIASLTLAAFCALPGIGALAQTNSFSTTGGTLTASTTAGGDVHYLNPSADVHCTVQFFATATYSRNWHCGGGAIHVEAGQGAIDGTVDPNPGYLNMVYVCGGGGRGNRGHCSYEMYAQNGYYYTVEPTTFSGTLTKSDGTVTQIHGVIQIAAGSTTYPGLSSGVNAVLTLAW